MTRAKTMFLLAALSLAPLTAIAADVPAPKPVEATGKADSGLRLRISLPAGSFEAGDPIRFKGVVTNAGGRPATFTQAALGAAQSLRITDANGKPVPFLAGPAGVAARPVTLDPGQSVDTETLDLTQWYYLRRPGRYTLWLPEGHGLPATEKLSFDVTPGPAATADGDPVGRLLPLVENRDGWILVAPAKDRVHLRYGGNRPDPRGRWILFQHHPAGGTKADTQIVWLRLVDDPTETPADAGEDWARDSKSLGKIGRWTVYAIAPEPAVKHWPTVLDDVRKALEPEKP